MGQTTVPTTTKPTPTPSPTARLNTVSTDPPWMCHACHMMVPDQSLQRCSQANCKAKRLQSDKGPPETKPLIGKEALKIITAADTGVTAEEDKKLKAEVDRLQKKHRGGQGERMGPHPGILGETFGRDKAQDDQPGARHSKGHEDCNGRQSPFATCTRGQVQRPRDQVHEGDRSYKKRMERHWKGQ